MSEQRRTYYRHVHLGEYLGGIRYLESIPVACSVRPVNDDEGRGIAQALDVDSWDNSYDCGTTRQALGRAQAFLQR